MNIPSYLSNAFSQKGYPAPTSAPAQPTTATPADRFELTNPASAPELQKIVTEARSTGIGREELPELVRTGVTISSAILGGPAGTTLQMQEQDGAVSARLLSDGQTRQLPVDSDSLCIGTLRVDLPDGRKAEVDKYGADGLLTLYISDSLRHRVDVQFDNQGQAVGSGTFSEKAPGSEGVRLYVEGQDPSLEIIAHQGPVSKYASPFYLAANCPRSINALRDLSYDEDRLQSLPAPSVEEMAGVRDRALADLAADHFQYLAG